MAQRRPGPFGSEVTTTGQFPRIPGDLPAEVEYGLFARIARWWRGDDARERAERARKASACPLVDHRRGQCRCADLARIDLPDAARGVETVASTVTGIPATEQHRGVAVDAAPAANVPADDDPEFWPSGRVRCCPEIQRSDLGGVPHVARCWLHADHVGEACRFDLLRLATDPPPSEFFRYGVIAYRLKIAERALVQAGWTRDEHGREWLPPARRADRAALLTEDEMRAMDLSCELANLLKRIIGDGPQAEGDNAERCAMIHAIQRTIMSQAAARAYPDKYRLLGGRR